MLCPEVWDFKPPQHQFFTTVTPNLDAIKTHYFNHSVSVVLPDTVTVPDSLQTCLVEDSDYYRVNALCPSELLNKEFIEAFVKKGELTLLTVGKNIDLHNSVAITPTGILIISVIADDYQKLGLEGQASFFDRTVHTRHGVTIDLKAESFIPGKKNYEKARTALGERLGEKFDVIVSWNPPEEKLCPSSVAAWFHERGYNVSVCQQKSLRRTEYSLTIPTCAEGYSNDEMFEWLGVFSIAGDLKNGNADDYVNTYECPSPSMQVGQVQYLQWTGFFTRTQVATMYNAVKEYAATRNHLPWCSLHVQGFADSPTNWDLKEHTFFTDGDNSYTVLFQPDGKCTVRKSLSCNRKPRIVQ